ncbi:hypothetical protein PS15m_005677 [Mucor circinelloides]
MFYLPSHNASLRNPKNLHKQLEQDEDVNIDCTEPSADQSTGYDFANHNESDSTLMQD